MCTLTLVLLPGVPHPQVSADHTITVDSAADVADADPGDGVCDTGDGRCTLRAAVMHVNAEGPGHTIHLPDPNAVPNQDDRADAYRLTIVGGSGAGEGDLDISEDVTIRGDGAAVTVIDASELQEAGQPDRIFETTAANLTVTGVTLTGGSDGEDEEGGGAIRHCVPEEGGTLNVSNSVIVGNTTATDGGGVAVFAEDESTAAVVLTGTVMRDNGAVGNGGGLSVQPFPDECVPVVVSVAEGPQRGAPRGGWGTPASAQPAAEGGVTVVAGGSFFTNEAGSAGGALRAGDLRVDGTAFVGNVAEGSGGALRSVGNLDLSRTEFRGNSARQGGGVSAGGGGSITAATFVANLAVFDGGGIYNSSDLEVTASTLHRNRAGRDGGGIAHVSGTVAVVESTLSENIAGDPELIGDEGPGDGGGLYSGTTISGEVTIDRSAIVGNEASGYGGGLAGDQTTTMRVRISTVSDNVAMEGGGVSNEGGTLRLTRSTIAFNRATELAPAVLNEGEMVMTHTLIACHESEQACVFQGGEASTGHNMTDDRSCLVASPPDTDQQVDHDDIAIDGLRDNGGSTVTHALRPSSPAIDSGSPDACPADGDGDTSDQRSRSIVDGNGDGTEVCDIGAFEFQQGVSIRATADADEDGPIPGHFELTRQGPTADPLEVRVATSGTATPTEDYDPLSPAVTIPAGSTSTTLDVHPVQDGEAEPTESVTVTLQRSADYTVGRGASATLVILDERPTVTVTVSDPDASEDGPDHGEFRFTRDGHLAEPLEVAFDISGTATEGLDVKVLPRTVLIPAGSGSATLTVEVLSDDVEDPGEIVAAVLREDPDYEVGSPASAVLRIDEPGARVVRSGGRDRIETAVQVSRTRFLPGVASAVVLARADDYPDALAGAPLAATMRAPLLLTGRDRLHEAVAEEIVRLDVDRAVLLGGEQALSPRVAADIAELGIDRIERIGGTDRFATAASIARQLPGPDLGYVVEGANPDPNRGWPDAVSVSGLAASELRPILLVTRHSVPAATAQAVEDLELRSIVVVGGPVAVSHEVADDLRAVGLGVERVAGATRYETSVRIAERTTESIGDPRRTWVATGRSFPDALVAGAAVAEDRGVLLLVDGRDLDGSPASRDWIADLPKDRLVIRILGGTAAISDEVLVELADLVGAG